MLINRFLFCFHILIDHMEYREVGYTMTYYEEFSISPMATREEIRHAHRRLIKILHPDLQSEEHTRQLAEIQTCRINGIAETLLDSNQRKAYNAGLVPTALHRPVTKRPYYSAAVALAALGVVAMLGQLLQVDRTTLVLNPSPPSSPHTPAYENPHQPNTVPAITNSASATRLTNRDLPATPAREQDQARPDTGAKTLDTKPEPRDVVSNTHADIAGARPFTVAALKTMATPPSNQSANPVKETDHTESGNPLIGTWVYVPAPLTEEDRTIYRPEYIEMRIRNVKGVIEGQYRARYHVPDRPLSPNVGFRFAGQSGTESTEFRWNSSNGIAGKVQLKMMTANSVQVDWRVTELADSADLVSGTAILTRVQ